MQKGDWIEVEYPGLQLWINLTATFSHILQEY